MKSIFCWGLLLLSFLASGASRIFRGASKTYRLLEYGEIVDYLHELEDEYPQYVELYTSEDEFGLTMPEELTCRRNGQVESCRQYILRLTNQDTLPDATRPQIFLSGAVHGNERVGPAVVLEYATLLLEHAAREDGNLWLKHLINTRDIYIMPTTNPHGYSKNHRHELWYDPNRDFPYMITGDRCMKTMTARGVNELWRHQIFQLGITFHAGQECITHPWGGFNHVTGADKFGANGVSDTSPDDTAQHQITTAMSRFGGKFSRKGYYRSGKMSEVVYAVSGGMEDWGYASSWENDLTSEGDTLPIGKCTPSTYDEYPASRTQYNDATHRAFNILVETSVIKNPSDNSLGNDQALSNDELSKYLPTTVSVGHIPRNVRLALLYTDLVQPYINWDISLEPKTISLGESLQFNWEVLGAFTIDTTALQYSFSSSFDEGSVQSSTEQSGISRWYHEDIDASEALGRSNDSTNGKFEASLSFEEAGAYYVRVVAIVDQDWAEQADVPTPNVGPQSHLVNARTNTDWYYENNGFVVQGRREWYSQVIEVNVE